jgi:preprotein translocase subunit SecG
MIYTFLIIIHVIVSFLLILLVLVQSDKGSGLAGAFGGMGGVNTVFGGRGTASILTKATTWMAISFMTLCIFLNLFVARQSSDQVKSILQKRAENIEKVAPASALPQQFTDPSKSGQAPLQIPQQPQQ